MPHLAAPMTSMTISGLVNICKHKLIAVAVTCVVMFAAFASLPAPSSDGGLLSSATSTVAPSNAEAFFRFAPVNRWIQFRSRRPLQQTPSCFFDPTCGQIA